MLGGWGRTLGQMCTSWDGSMAWPVKIQEGTILELRTTDTRDWALRKSRQKRKPVRTGRGRLEDWGQARLGEQWEWIWNLFWGNGKPLAGLKEKVMISFASLNNYFWCRMDPTSCRWHPGSLSPSPPSFFLSGGFVFNLCLIMNARPYFMSICRKAGRNRKDSGIPSPVTHWHRTRSGGWREDLVQPLNKLFLAQMFLALGIFRVMLTGEKELKITEIKYAMYFSRVPVLKWLWSLPVLWWSFRWQIGEIMVSITEPLFLDQIR